MNSLISKHDQLFRELFSNSIGMDRLIDRLSNTTPVSFPPYNIFEEGNTTYVELALAGYKKEDVNVVVEDGVLSIEGSSSKAPLSNREDIHRGIASRRFKRAFSLGEYIEVKSAELKDGLLTIMLEEILPPEKQPKVIDIK